MKNSKWAVIVTLLSSIPISGCQQTGPFAGDASTVRPGSHSYDNRVPAAMKTKGAIDGLESFGSPYRLPGQTTWISSFVITKTRWLLMDKDPFREGGLAMQNDTPAPSLTGPTLTSFDVRWHNAAFVDRANDEHWALLSERGFISNWWALTSESGGNLRTLRLLFAATIDDTNGDGFLDDKDATVAVMTLGDGRRPKVVTPRDAQLQGLHYNKESGMIEFQLRLDKDKDAKFDEYDPVRNFYVRIGQIGLGEDAELPMAQRWHSEPFERDLNSLYR